ncbi:hypothetical protein ASF43_19600 [Pseudorhodoferax sp. Leaf267]|nr:hypothetical protein ASF43_19600 [Pseudorhodoferax sp. Leaf267]
MLSLPIPSQIQRLLTDTTRLYRLQGDGSLDALLVQAWSLQEALDTPWRLQLITLSTQVGLDPHAMLGQPLQLHTRLADGSEFARGGLVTEARAESADGGFARYCLTVEPWLALLAHTTRSQVWQERSVTEIVESLFALYPLATWRWSPCVAQHLATSTNAGLRSYTVQYRESDLAFLTRLLAREGICMRVAPDGTLVLLADSVSREACEQDVVSASALGGAGVRYHASGAQEHQDAIQAFGATRTLPSASTTVLSWDYQAKRAVAAEVPTAHAWGGANAPALQDYALPGAYAHADTEQAARAALLQRQSVEARHKTWQGRSTVRSFTAGHWFQLTESDMDALDALGQSEEDKRFVLTAVTHAGLNNLPQSLAEQVVQQLGHADVGEGLPAALIAQARATGYGNTFEAIRAQVPWRPQPAPPREYPGMLTATVVGPQGETQASGAEEIHMDRLGRIRIRFDFQTLTQGPHTSSASSWVRVLQRWAGAAMGTQASGAEEIHMDRLGRIRIRFDFQTLTQGPHTSSASSWVRVLQRWAGAAMGSQFIPRIGQEVLVDFFEGDIERPMVVGALYNGQGEAGRRPTPGGQAAQDDLSPLASSGDHRPGAQGNLAGGHSPAWHGAGAGAVEAGGQANAAALSGIKTKEYGGWGYNQLVFDDSDQQLRTQLATSQYDTQLNLGHLIHQAWALSCAPGPTGPCAPARGC